MKYQLSKRNDYSGQTFTMPSLTIPDQTMSIRTILEKYARGENFNQRHPIFTEEDNTGLDIRKLDLSEIHELKQTNEKQIREYQELLATKQAEKAKKDEDERIRLAAERIVAENVKGSEKPS
jgi:hypothetical protein